MTGFVSARICKKSDKTVCNVNLMVNSCGLAKTLVTLDFNCSDNVALRGPIRELTPDQ